VLELSVKELFERLELREKACVEWKKKKKTDNLGKKDKVGG